MSGSGWLPNSIVTFTFSSPEGTALGSARVDAGGSFSAQVAIPADAAAGSHRLVVTGTVADGSQGSVELLLTVLGSDGSDGSGRSDRSGGSGARGGGGVASTGLNTLGAGVLGLVLLTGGVTVVVSSGRRGRAGGHG